MEYVTLHNRNWSAMVPRLRLLPRELLPDPTDEIYDDTMQEASVEDLQQGAKKGAALRAAQTQEYRDRMNEDATVSIHLRRKTLDVLTNIDASLNKHNTLIDELTAYLRVLKRSETDY